MSRSIGGETRQAVAKRAGFRCEYCLIHEDDAYLAFQIGKATVKILDLNTDLRIAEREALIEVGRYPTVKL